MKKVLLFTGLAILLLACDSQKNAPYLEDQFDKAIAFNDNITAIFYLHELRALDPSNNTVYTRLAEIYSKVGNHSGALIAVDQAMEKANKLEQKDLMFIKFRALKALRQNKEAVSILDTLASLDTERALEYSYEAAVLYFDMQDLTNAQLRMEKVLRHPLADKTAKSIISDYGEDKVTYRYAAMNFIGYIKIMLGDFMVAEQLYVTLLQQEPNFTLAQNNYQLLQQQKVAAKAKK